MMYQALAKYYDALVKDDEATSSWVSLIHTYLPKGKVMELACGSGEITIALAKQGYEVSASDISEDMIKEAKKKAGSELIRWSVMDMSDIQDQNIYDGILCLCDSFNYLLNDAQVDQMLKGVYTHLSKQGVFIMDMHSMDRLDEFEEEYNEAGKIMGHEYQWTIYAVEDRVYQNFAFYDEAGRVTLEQHIQRVYDPMDIKKRLEQLGFQVDIYTDFTQAGVCEGEKQFFICRKGNI